MVDEIILYYDARSKKHQISRRIFEKILESNFMIIRPVGGGLFHADRICYGNSFFFAEFYEKELQMNQVPRDFPKSEIVRAGLSEFPQSETDCQALVSVLCSFCSIPSPHFFVYFV